MPAPVEVVGAVPATSPAFWDPHAAGPSRLTAARAATVERVRAVVVEIARMVLGRYQRVSGSTRFRTLAVDGTGGAHWDRPSEGQPMSTDPMSAWRDTAPTDYAGAALVHRAVRRVGGIRPVSLVLARTLHHLDRPVIRASGGRHTLTSLLTGLTVADLTTTGARTGQPRRTPVLGFPADDGLVVIASNYGQQHHPAWYHNLLAHPEAELLVRGRSTPVVAHLTQGDQRARLWAHATTLYPSWDRYAERAAGREIGVFVLRPTAHR